MLKFPGKTTKNKTKQNKQTFLSTFLVSYSNLYFNMFWFETSISVVYVYSAANAFQLQFLCQYHILNAGMPWPKIHRCNITQYLLSWTICIFISAYATTWQCWWPPNACITNCQPKLALYASSLYCEKRSNKISWWDQSWMNESLPLAITARPFPLICQFSFVTIYFNKFQKNVHSTSTHAHCYTRYTDIHLG